MEQTLNKFALEYKQKLIAQCYAKFDNDLSACETSMEEAMCKAELKSNIKKVESNIDPFKTQKPDTTDFDCIGCGS